MAENTSIEWCDHTWSPWEGCQKVGPGCDHCYAEARNGRFSKGANWGPGAPRRKTADWSKPDSWNRRAAAAGRRESVFPSLCDPFDNAVPVEWRAELWLKIACTPNLNWMLLTKRIGNAHRMAEDVVEQISRVGITNVRAWPANLWLGATVVTQQEADRDIPKLLAVPASVRFLSVEPMLGPIDLRSDLGGTRWIGGQRGCGGTHRHGGDPSVAHDHGPGTAQTPGDPRLPHHHHDTRCRRGIDWVICGGESGPGARPMHPDWARSLRDQCAAAGVAFMFKQWGEWTPGENVERERGTVDTAILWGDGWHVHPLNLATDDGHVDDEPDLYRVGKKAAGRLLDGVEHNGFPNPASLSGRIDQ